MFSVSAECSRCGEKFPLHRVLTICTECGGALLIKYDLARVAEKLSKRILEKRKDTFWKFKELLPLSSHRDPVSLGEPYTPVLPLSDRNSSLLKNVYVKDDGRLPTGTFKARGMAVTISKFKELDITRVAVPSAGNAAGALAAYGAKAGIEIYVFMPKDVPESNLKECVYLGAKVYLVDGLIGDAAEIARRLRDKYGWFDLSTNKQPYRFEGYKAMAFEMAEQFKWDLPDNIIFPTGGGEGIIGLWKGFKELTELGWISRTPRLTIVQSSGCAPLVEAYSKGETEVKEAWRKPATIAAGLRVPYPYASSLTLRAVRETHGHAVSVEDNEIISSMKNLFKMGLYACPEASATLAGLSKLVNERALDPKEKTLLYLTGTALKYFDIMQTNRNQIPILERNTNSLG